MNASSNSNATDNYVTITPLCTEVAAVVGTGNATIFAHSGGGSISIGSVRPGETAVILGIRGQSRTRVSVWPVNGTHYIIGYITTNRLGVSRFLCR